VKLDTVERLVKGDAEAEALLANHGRLFQSTSVSAGASGGAIIVLICLLKFLTERFNPLFAPDGGLC
jgi:hypothetical protein